MRDADYQQLLAKQQNAQQQQVSQYHMNLMNLGQQLGVGTLYGLQQLQPYYTPSPAPVRLRCSYCGVKTDPAARRCDGCGAPA